jgi:alkylresorcinol/alkylpyrone synthase
LARDARAVLVGLATASPGEPIPQERLKNLLADLWVGSDAGLRAMMNVFETSGVVSRHFAMPLEAYPAIAESFSKRNEKFVEVARELNLRASRFALARAGLAPADVTHVVLVTSTGISTPSLDALLLNELPLDPSVRRYPIWGLGCGGGAAALGLARDLARTAEDAVVLVVVVELCSLAFVPGDRTKRNLVATALFADGCAAAVVAGSGRGLELSTHRTTTWPETLDMMGWELRDGGLGLILSRSLPAFARERMGPVLADLRASLDWDEDEQPAFLALHPGGPKVLAAVGEAIGAPESLLAPARRVLARHGNMSAPTFLYVLDEILRETPDPAGPGVYSAMGPGFTCDVGVLSPAPVSDVRPGARRPQGAPTAP